MRYSGVKMRITDFRKAALSTVSAAMLILPMLTSCQSSQKAGVTISPDDYYSDQGDSQSSLPQVVRTPAEAEPMTAEDSIKSARRKTNAFQDFFTIGNKNELMICDQTSLFTTGVSGKPTQKEAIIALNTKDGTAGFGSPYLAAYYIVQMDETARKKLAKAVDDYISDFDNKRLQRKGRNLLKQYGAIDVRLHWGSLRGSTPNNGSGKLNMGYSFENKSPYFTLSTYPVKNDYYDVVGDSTTRESLSLKYYFTKAQARALVEMLSDEALADYLGVTKPFIPVESDEY